MAKSTTGAKSAKALKAASRKRSGGGGGLKTPRQIPWLTVGAVVAIVALIGILAYNLVPKYQEKAENEKFTPSDSNKDPSAQIDGIVKQDNLPQGLHVKPDQRVAYDRTPPFGGPHDGVWATCTGTVYTKPIRTENAVHSLEHGAVWIAYNPDKVDSSGIDELKSKVDGQSYTLMSPFPGLDSAISLQSWGHQLKLDNADDKRIGQFITALRQNRYTYPEVGASCATVPGSFDPDNPPPFDASPLPPNAVPMSGEGLTPDPTEMGGGAGIPGGGLPPGLDPNSIPGLDPNAIPGLDPNAIPPAPAPAPAPAPTPNG